MEKIFETLSAPCSGAARISSVWLLPAKKNTIRNSQTSHRKTVSNLNFWTGRHSASG